MVHDDFSFFLVITKSLNKNKMTTQKYLVERNSCLLCTMDGALFIWETIYGSLLFKNILNNLFSDIPKSYDLNVNCTRTSFNGGKWICPVEPVYKERGFIMWYGYPPWFQHMTSVKFHLSARRGGKIRYDAKLSPPTLLNNHDLHSLEYKSLCVPIYIGGWCLVTYEIHFIMCTYHWINVLSFCMTVSY